jgi:hypothetical protein
LTFDLDELPLALASGQIFNKKQALAKLKLCTKITGKKNKPLKNTKKH